jgi:hypothetical protein
VPEQALFRVKQAHGDPYVMDLAGEILSISVFNERLNGQYAPHLGLTRARGRAGR